MQYCFNLVSFFSILNFSNFLALEYKDIVVADKKITTTDSHSMEMETRVLDQNVMY